MKRHHRRGTASVYSLLAIAVVLVGTGSAASFAVLTMARSQSDARSAIAFEGAQAALELGLTQAFNELQTNFGEFRSRDYNYNTDIAAIAPGATANVTVRPTADLTQAWITSEVTFRGRTKSVRTLVRSRDVGIWNNAIFAGAGASGMSINGNVDIRGSVHILGDGEPFSDLNLNGVYDFAESFTDRNRNGVWDPGEPFVDANNDGVRNPAEPFNDVNRNGSYDRPLTSTDLNSALSGNAHIGNHYSGMPANLLAACPTPPQVGGVETLSAEVRVKNGRVSLSGSATIGSGSPIDNGSRKATVDGSYVSGGYTGTRGASSVFSDNGTNNPYDLDGLGISFPLITGIGAPQYTDRTGTVWTNQEQFLNSRSMTIPVTSITAATPAFSYGPDLNGNSVSFTPAGNRGNPPARLTVNGVIRFAGDLQIGAKDTITYAGSGTFYSAGTMRIDGNLLPAAGLTFPTTARMGFIARNDLMLATGNGSSQLQLAGAFYAQDTIVSAKQNQILGTFVASYYDMGQNVPNIYQVPSLPRNMPPAMPGDRSYVTMRLNSWRERR